MTLAGNGSSRARARTGWNARGALIASLMLNLLLLGAFAGSVWATRPEQDSGKGRLGLLEYIERLPPNRRDAIRSFIDSERPSLRPLREEVQQARAHAASILDADPLDKEKLAAAMQRLSEAEHAFHSAINGVFIRAAERMTLEERRSYQAWWLDRWARRKAHYDEQAKKSAR